MADARLEAMRRVRAKDWPNALIQLDRALRASPAAPQLLLSRAQCLIALGRRAEACATASIALPGSPPMQPSELADLRDE